MRLKKSIHVLTLTIVLSAMSCAAPRKAMSEQRSQTHSSQSETTSGETHLQDSAAMRTERLLNEWLAAWLQREETRDEATERVTEIFDTTQPPDSVTGTPPLSARIRERHETRKPERQPGKGGDRQERQHRHRMRGSLTDGRGHADRHRGRNVRGERGRKPGGERRGQNPRLGVDSPVPRIARCHRHNYQTPFKQTLNTIRQWQKDKRNRKIHGDGGRESRRQDSRGDPAPQSRHKRGTRNL